MTVRIAVLASLLLVGCSQTEGKNADPNNSTNNNSTNNNSTNNNSSTNNATNNQTGGTIDPTNYDQSCATDADCMLIRSGDPCSCEPCSDAAINRTDQQKWQDDVAAGMCAEIACPAIGCGEDQRPWCNAGTCEVRVAKYVTADDWDRSCTTADDCVAVYEGEVCDCRACVNTAINAGDLDDYNAAFDVTCESGLDCACAPATPACNEGLCEIP